MVLLKIILEETMLIDTIRNFFVLSTAIYTYYKLLNIDFRIKNFTILFFSITASIFSAYLFTSNSALNWLFVLILFFFIMQNKIKHSFATTYITCLFSFSFSYISFVFSTIITAFILFPFFRGHYKIPVVIYILIGLLQLFLIFCCFQIPRLRKGMRFLYHIPSNNIGSSLCIFVTMIIIMFSQSKAYSESFVLICLSIFTGFAFLLIYWWNYHLTQTYKKYLKINESATLELLLLEKDAEITHLKTENDKLSKLIHKDNKILPSLTMAVEDFLQNADKLSFTELNQLGSSLQTQLSVLYNERLSILNRYEQDFYTLPSTGYASINGVLMFMQQKASQLKIQYQLIISDNPSTVIPDTISEKDFSHLLSDLLDNAIIAARNSYSGIVRIHMGYFDDIYTLKIFNTGQPFSIDVLQNLGINRYTTHENTGGSGIGLMDIWKLKEQYSFTLFIDETTINTHETPSTTINILFNTQNHYIIQTDRYKELISSINRPDLLILLKNQVIT